jgi:hypothetical protein
MAAATKGKLNQDYVSLIFSRYTLAVLTKKFTSQ